MVVLYDKYGMPLIYDDLPDKANQRGKTPPEVPTNPPTSPPVDTPPKTPADDNILIPKDLQQTAFSDLGFGNSLKIGLPKPITGAKDQGFVKSMLDLIKEYLKI